MFTRLMTTRRFLPLFGCQFFSAFNDNFLKNSLAILILFSPAVADPDWLITLTPAVFIGPFFFLSGLGGEMADRFDKAVVAQRIKLVEIAVAAIAVTGYWLHSIPILFVALFMFGVIKYGILPDHLVKEELPAGNALVEGATFLAILLGTIVGGLAAKEGNHPAIFGVLIMVFALACWGSSLFIPRTGQGAPQLRIDPNIARSTWVLIKELWGDKRLRWGAMVTSWFWLVGAVALSLMPVLVKSVLGATQEVVVGFLAIFSISIAIGSGLAAWLAHGRIVLFPTLVGALVLAVFAFDLGWGTYGVAPSAPSGVAAVFGSARGLRVAIDLAGLAIGGGLFIVPTFSAVQAWAGADRRARVIAAVNVLNAAFIVAGTLLVALLQAFGLSTPALFMMMGAANLVIMVAIAATLPTNLLRDFLTVMFRVLFRLEVTGIENLAKAGPNAIIALNHLSFLDASVALSFLEDRKSTR